jgi:hypothetical protein
MARILRKRRIAKRRPRLVAIAQGVGKVPDTPLGAKNQKKKNGNGNGKSKQPDPLRGLCALDPTHLPLPRPVGPYLPVRLTTVYNWVGSPDHEFMIIGPCQSAIPGSVQQTWSNCVALLNRKPTTDPINVEDGWWAITQNFDAFAGSGCTIVPAACTVQVMNTAALQTTSGVIWGGRFRTMPDLGTSTTPVATLINSALEFNAPRNMSAGKLALRGVQGDLVPGDMNDLSDFRPISTRGTPFTWSQNDFGPAGFLPAFIYNQSRVPLQIIITVEYRVRFPVDNVASAAHRRFHATPSSVWERGLNAMESLGHGMLDIVTVGASLGAAARRMGLLGGVEAAGEMPVIPP